MAMIKPARPPRRMHRTLLALVLALSACSSEENSEELLVFAASSLTEAMTAIAVEFEELHPELEVQLNFAGSATLAQQIMGGAKADVLLVANTQIMDDLLDAGTVGTPQTAALNRMVLVVPQDNPAKVTGLADLENESLLVGLCSESVPCGAAAREILESAGVEIALDTNEPDVRSLLAKVSQGELDAGIVYTTDLSVEELPVSSITIEPDLYLPNRYPVAIVSDTDSTAAAEGFVAFVLSPRGRQVFADYEFLTPESSGS